MPPPHLQYNAAQPLPVVGGLSLQELGSLGCRQHAAAAAEASSSPDDWVAAGAGGAGAAGKPPQQQRQGSLSAALFTAYASFVASRSPSPLGPRSAESEIALRQQHHLAAAAIAASTVAATATTVNVEAVGGDWQQQQQQDGLCSQEAWGGLVPGRFPSTGAEPPQGAAAAASGCWPRARGTHKHQQQQQQQQDSSHSHDQHHHRQQQQHQVLESIASADGSSSINSFSERSLAAQSLPAAPAAAPAPAGSASNGSSSKPFGAGFSSFKEEAQRARDRVHRGALLPRSFSWAHGMSSNSDQQQQPEQQQQQQQQKPVRPVLSSLKRVPSVRSILVSRNCSCCSGHLPYMDRPVLVMAWLHDLLLQRQTDGGLHVPAPILQRVYAVSLVGVSGERRVNPVAIAHQPVSSRWRCLPCLVAHCLTPNSACLTAWQRTSSAGGWVRVLLSVCVDVPPAITNLQRLPAAPLMVLCSQEAGRHAVPLPLVGGGPWHVSV
jgi:hypothetical protein